MAEIAGDPWAAVKSEIYCPDPLEYAAQPPEGI